MTIVAGSEQVAGEVRHLPCSVAFTGSREQIPRANHFNVLEKLASPTGRLTELVAAPAKVS